MVQFLLSFLLLAMLGVALLVSTFTGPRWSDAARMSTSALGESLARIETAYDETVRAGNGAALEPSSSADGGFEQTLGPALGMRPFALPGYRWTFGARPMDGSPLAGLRYACMEPSTEGAVSTEGDYRILAMLVATQASGQTLLSSGCGASAGTTFGSFPTRITLTHYLMYTPGVSP